MRLSMYRLLIIPIFFVFTSCIGDYYIDDFVEPTLRLSNSLDSIAVGDSFQLSYRYFDNAGRETSLDAVTWNSSDPDKIAITSTGLMTGVAIGKSTISISAMIDGLSISSQQEVTVGANTVVTEQTTKKSGTLRSTSQYLLNGSFTLEEQEDGTLLLSFGDDFVATTALPELHGFLSNNANSFQGALDLGATTIYKGAHSFVIGPGVGIDDYKFLTYWCLPFAVKVGDATIE
jgi:hypothetical protein